MKKLSLFLLSVFTAVLFFASCGGKTVTADYQVIPLPQQVALSDGNSFMLDNSTAIVYPAGNERLKKTAGFLAEYLNLATGMTFEVTDTPQDKNAILLTSDLKHDNTEAYTLIIDKDLVKISGASDAGVFYGIQTLRKSIPAEEAIAQVEFPAVSIADYPRFGYRGAMLDCARHFFPTDFVKKYIDILALHNINRFHWHITDDQGWRIEIKKYPELTTVGANRKETLVGHYNDQPRQYDGEPYGGFYTQEEAKDIVAYAADRHITIIPEVDMPGHMLAALETYPELGCTGGPYAVSPLWGVFDDVLCIGNEKTFEFLEGVYAEIVEIFPSKYIHIGGDECPRVRWKACPKCQARIKALGLKADKHHTAEDKLQSYCTARVEKFLNSKGREIIGWDEILEGGLAPNATVMSWRGTEGGIAAANLGHDAIMVPSPYLYFDYYQTEKHDKEPLAIGGYIPVERVYNYEPIPAEVKEELRKHIIGVQSNIWTEYIKTTERVEYQLLPRLAALSEVQWTQPEKKNYDNFTKRLYPLTKLYDQFGYTYARYIFDIQSEVENDAPNKSVKVSLWTIDDAPIYYTLDGTEPTANSTRYTAPVELKETALLKAVAIRDGSASEVYSSSFTLDKATFKSITSSVPPVKVFDMRGTPQMLLNGQHGINSSRDKQWVGFVGDMDYMDFYIDLGEMTEVSSVKVGTYIDTNDWIFGPTGLQVYASEDGKSYKDFAQSPAVKVPESVFAGRVDMEAKAEPAKARYLRVRVNKTPYIPDWHDGKGYRPYILIDEIEVK
ncbi:family 20 glycosylhydrolase [Dysgonomonas sp. 25]|uniref:glycoside hydrolase family 20 protein n=1 Tax=Dysgonomonas sp. 25 TaxID=2302933 RepID=UPI0013D31430|nr:family 20 glycosylhydrolase [Dysgonomonas sp. 25]NDV70413.1 beta-N-acetylhexosaminidase [Dysgonomonas sp. 25]